MRTAQVCHCGEHGWADLTRGCVAIFDAEYTAVFALHYWNANWDGKNFYARRGETHRVDGKLRNISVSMHTSVVVVPEGLVVDHKNRNTLDNRRKNLRVASYGQNAANARFRVGTTSKFRGVCRYGKGWRAMISSQGRREWLGTFDTEIEAARAYDDAAVRLHGAAATLNRDYFVGEAA
jgi:hypothetical protein